MLLPELPGEEEDVMAVTSASSPSLTTLTASVSGLGRPEGFGMLLFVLAPEDFLVLAWWCPDRSAAGFSTASPAPLGPGGVG